MNIYQIIHYKHIGSVLSLSFVIKTEEDTTHYNGRSGIIHRNMGWLIEDRTIKIYSGL